MSFFFFQQQCRNCGKDWTCSFGMVGTTQIGGGALPACPYCSSTDIADKPELPAQEIVLQEVPKEE